MTFEEEVAATVIAARLRGHDASWLREAQTAALEWGDLQPMRDALKYYEERGLLIKAGATSSELERRKLRNPNP